MSGGLFLSPAEVSSSPYAYAWPVKERLLRKKGSVALSKHSLMSVGGNTNHLTLVNLSCSMKGTTFLRWADN